MKLVSWNTQWCCGLDGTVSPQRIVDGARAMADFDVLCLQEISQGFQRLQGAPGDQPAQIAALLPGFRCFPMPTPARSAWPSGDTRRSRWAPAWRSDTARRRAMTEFRDAYCSDRARNS